MRLLEVDPYDDGHLETLTELNELARAHDDPQAFVHTIEDTRNAARYGGDLNPGRMTLLVEDEADGGEAVGNFFLDVPVHDNRHLVEAGITVRPDRRGRGHGTLMLEEVVRRTAALGRSTLWIGTADDDAVATAFLARRGFTPASRDARRHQVLAEVDGAELDRLEQDAAEHGRDYVLERIEPPYEDALLAELLTATTAINDAPMGALVFEDEVYDLDRMRHLERARELRAERMRRVVARHCATGEIAGHTFLNIRPWAPRQAYQWETAVARHHRGHRLGVAVKIEMMHWLAEAEPQLEVIETWNNVDNLPMINVNEAIGYRLSREFAMFQRQLAPSVG